MGTIVIVLTFILIFIGLLCPILSLLDKCRLEQKCKKK